jgi:hypothetical protein
VNIKKKKKEIIAATQKYTEKPKRYTWIPLTVLTIFLIVNFFNSSLNTPEFYKSVPIRIIGIFIAVIIGINFFFRNINANSNSKAKQDIIKKLSLYYQKEYQWGQAQALAQADIDFVRNGPEHVINFLISKNMWSIEL